MLLAFLVLWFAVTGVVILLYARRDMTDIWREPVLLCPVIIVESDDWGAGPAEQAAALGSIKSVLENVSDTKGRHPVMTLGVILATPDAGCVGDSNKYCRRVISIQTHADMLDVINDGIDAGVFSVQLHGMEHFWPATLLAAAQTNVVVRDWLQQSPDVFTEMLPAHLQSRWVDTSVLPSRPLPADEARLAVTEEVKSFCDVFGTGPAVVVPPTFIWTSDVERAWASAGVKVVVTPGRCIESLDADGLPVATGNPVYNAQAGLHDTVYMVRNVYFEPSLGHKAEQVLTECESRLRLARPVLLETHRFNFIGPQADLAVALKELEYLLHGAVERFPNVAFISTEKLAGILKNCDAGWVEHRLLKKIHIWIERLGVKSRLRKMVTMSGWIIPVWLLWKVTQ